MCGCVCGEGVCGWESSILSSTLSTPSPLPPHPPIGPQRLNTHYPLYTALTAALAEHDRATAAGGVSSNNSSSSSSGSRNDGSSDPPPSPHGGGWTPECLLVGRMLARDFERYGVHLQGAEQDRMSTLVQRAQVRCVCA